MPSDRKRKADNTKKEGARRASPRVDVSDKEVIEVDSGTDSDDNNVVASDNENDGEEEGEDEKLDDEDSAEDNDEEEGEDEDKGEDEEEGEDKDEGGDEDEGEEESAEESEGDILARIEANAGTDSMWRVLTHTWCIGYRNDGDNDTEGPCFTSEWQALLYCAKANSDAYAKKIEDDKLFDPDVMTTWSRYELREYNNWFETEVIEGVHTGKITRCFEMRDVMQAEDLLEYIS